TSPIKKSTRIQCKPDGVPFSFNLRSNKYARKPKKAIECIEWPLAKLSELTSTRCSKSGRGLSKMAFNSPLSSRTPIRLKTNKSAVQYLFLNKETHIRSARTRNNA